MLVDVRASPQPAQMLVPSGFNCDTAANVELAIGGVCDLVNAAHAHIA